MNPALLRRYRVALGAFIAGLILSGITAFPLLHELIPLATICGPIRGIPLYWRFIDCSFGVFGSIPLLFCLNLVRRMKKEKLN